MSDLTFICDTLSPPPAAKPAKAVRVIRPSESRTPTYRPDDPDLQAATMALSGPLWNGPRPSQVQHVRNGGSQIQARFDNAQYNADMRKHWAMADYLGPDAAANPGVRYLLRIRSRYEVANNSYARGIVTTLANDTIGRGPRLHMTTADTDVNREVKAKFNQWAKEVDLPGKLRTMRMAKCQDGEGFCVQSNRNVTQQSLDRGGSPVWLNLRIFEADQCATVSAMLFSVPSVDGIELDEHFQPKNYFILRIHPGNYVYLPGYVGFPWDYDTFPASKVCHWYRKDRPELHRGIPELTPALNLFAQLRDYTNSILKSARIQSSWAIAIQTNAPAGLQEVASVAPMDTFDFEDGMAMTMPQGWEARGLNPTFPDAKYPTFKRELLCEIGRCINMPLCVIAGDSSGYNYASGRLDFQVYRKSIEVDRSECEQAVLDKILQWWIDEAVLIEGYLPQAARRLKADMSHQWLWDEEEHVDPTKESSAAETRLGTLTSNLAIEWQKNGVEWEEGLEQIARELAFKKKLEAEYGIQFPSPKNQGTPEKPEDDSEPVDDSQPGEEPDDSQEPTEAGRKAGTILARRRKTRKAIQAADSEPRDTGKWITTESGTHIHLDSSGHIDKGPPDLVNKTVAHLSREAHRKGEKADESHKAADHEAARDAHKTVGEIHRSLGNHDVAQVHESESQRHDSAAKDASQPKNPPPGKMNYSHAKDMAKALEEHGVRVEVDHFGFWSQHSPEVDNDGKWECTLKIRNPKTGNVHLKIIKDFKPADAATIVKEFKKEAGIRDAKTRKNQAVDREIDRAAAAQPSLTAEGGSP